jgi:hypothetical protein
MPRPKPIIDYNLIEKLANLGCTEYEIAYALNYSPKHFSSLKRKDTLIREAINRGSNGIKISIRRAQLKVALPDESREYAGNPTMLIWLGKQYLHQSDHLKIGGEEDAPLKYVLKWADEVDETEGEGDPDNPPEAAQKAELDS